MTIPKTFVKVNRKTFVSLVSSGLMALGAIGLDLSRGAPIRNINAEV